MGECRKEDKKKTKEKRGDRNKINEKEEEKTR